LGACIYIHNSCRASYTLARNMKQCVAKAEQVDLGVTTNIVPVTIDGQNADQSVQGECVAGVASQLTETVVQSELAHGTRRELFDFMTCCLFCGSDIQYRHHLVSTVRSSQTKETLMQFAGNSTDELRNTIAARIRFIDLVEVGAKYHKTCFTSFTKTKCDIRSLPATAVQQNDVSLNVSQSDLPSDLIQCETGTVWSVDNCGPARSHAEYLQNVGRMNHIQLLQTVGGGDCFFNAIEFGLQEFGMVRSIQELRNVAATELYINRHQYAHRYVVEDYEQRQQARTFETFVELTGSGSEWATELTVTAMARGLNMVICVISTAGPSTQPSAFCRFYREGVTRHDQIITVGFNAVEGHYVGFRCGVVPVIADVSRHFSAMSVDTNPDVAVGMSVGSVSGFAEQEADQAMDEDDGDDVFGTETTMPIPTPTQPHGDISMSVSSEYSMMGCQPQHSLSHNQCANCRRCETADCLLQLKTHRGAFIHRHIRLLAAASGESTLCDLCMRYLTTKVKQSQLWCCAWPSVIAVLLSKFANLRNDVWSILPPNHRTAWEVHANSVGLATELHVSSHFEDFTEHAKRYTVLTTSGDIGDFMKAMSQFAFPCIRCPAGCFAYCDECSNVPFNHFLYWKFGIQYFKGDKKCFTGARNDWPISSTQLEVFKVKPGLIIDPQLGLCVMMCSRHGKGLFESIIHVPLNPVLRDIGLQFPDTTAAAILTPNCIRSGRMNRWTNSSHVVAAVGGYTGISSSSIAQKFDSAYQDERLSAANCLAMKHRSDTYYICQNRYADMPGGDEELQRELRNYEKKWKPSPLSKRAALDGASYIDVQSSFSINEHMYRRDTNLTEDEKAGAHVEPWLLGLTFIHPTTDHGCQPVNLNSMYNVEKHALTGALLHLCIHCPALHDVLLCAFEVQRQEYLMKLLRFVQYCAGQSANHSGIRNANECDQLTKSELTTRKISNSSKCVLLVDLLKSLSSSISAEAFSVEENLSELSPADTTSIFIVYRPAKCRLVRESLVMEFDQFHLVCVLCGPHLTDTVFFRWNDGYTFWKITCKLKEQLKDCLAENSITVYNWQILVYARTVSKNVMNEQLECSLNAQQRMHCDYHKLFLVKQPLTCELGCCVKNCTRTARWRCMARGLLCVHGICLAHGTDLVNGDDVVQIEDGMDGRVLKKPKLPVVDTSSEAASRGTSRITSPDSDLDSDEDDIDVRVLAPIGMEDICSDNDPAPVHSRRDLIPMYDTNQHLPAHYLWNSRYNVMRRTSRNCSVRTNAILQHIVSSTNDASVSLLYPEAQLFPRIFWCAQSGSVVGAIPSFMLNSSTKKFHGMASLSEHYDIWIRDGCLLTSKYIVGIGITSLT